MKRPTRPQVFLLHCSPTFAKHNLDDVLRKIEAVRNWRRVMGKVIALQVEPAAKDFADTFSDICDRLGGAYLLSEVTDTLKGSLPKHQWSFVIGMETKKTKRVLPPAWASPNNTGQA